MTPKLIAWATSRLATSRTTSCAPIGARGHPRRRRAETPAVSLMVRGRSRARHLGVEQIARAAVGLDDLALHAGVQLAPQAADLHVHRPVEDLGLGAARLFQELVAGGGAAGFP